MVRSGQLESVAAADPGTRGPLHLFAPPIHTNHPAAIFSPAAWNPAQKVALITPALVNGKRMGVDPRTGTVYPAVAIGLIAPGSGNFANGMVLNTAPGVPLAIVGTPPISRTRGSVFRGMSSATARRRFAAVSVSSRAQGPPVKARQPAKPPFRWWSPRLFLTPR